MQQEKRSIQSRYLVLILALAIAAGSGIVYWKVRRDRASKVAAVEQLIDEGMYGEAMVLLRSIAEHDTDPRLFRSQVECLIALGRYEELHNLYFRDPAFFQTDEQAALVVARTLCSRGDNASYRSLRGQWTGRETRLAAWLAFDADQLIRAGRHDEAKQLLSDGELPTGSNAGRLTRLAMLHQGSPNQAWDYLQQAYRDSPRDPTVRLFRGQILETTGRNAEARVEYVAACLADTANPAMRDQLARFYQRRGNLYQAVRTWSEGIDQTPADFIEFSVLFWNRLAHPAKVHWDGRQLSPGRCQPLVKYLIELPAERWWDQTRFTQAAPDAEAGIAKPELRWLQVLDRLQAGDVQAVSTLLAEHRIQLEPINPPLYRVLSLWGSFMVHGELDPFDQWEIAASGDPDRHQFLRSIDAWHAEQKAGAENAGDKLAGQSSTELESFFASRRALAAMLMTTGWVEAAIRFDEQCESLPTATPDWYGYAMVQALRMNRSPEQALSYLKTQASTPELKLVHGEILLGLNQATAAEAQLRPLSTLTNAVGRRANWLLSIELISRGSLSEAKRFVDSNPGFAGSVNGQELLAQIAVATGDEETATRIMAAIEQDSIQAKAFLARQAYSAERWEESERLTAQLIEEIPDAMQLRENLRSIDAAKRSSAN